MLKMGRHVKLLHKVGFNKRPNAYAVSASAGDLACVKAPGMKVQELGFTLWLFANECM